MLTHCKTCRKKGKILTISYEGLSCNTHRAPQIPQGSWTGGTYSAWKSEELFHCCDNLGVKMLNGTFKGGLRLLNIEVHLDTSLTDAIERVSHLEQNIGVSSESRVDGCLVTGILAYKALEPPDVPCLVRFARAERGTPSACCSALNTFDSFG